MTDRPCRFCGAPLHDTFADLGISPLANSYVPVAHRDRPETFYPLHAYVCRQCWLVQLEEFESAENIFSDYLYFSSFSDMWLKHSAAYAAYVTDRFRLGNSSKVVEIASNDGYLLQYFRDRGINVLGVEPAANVAVAAVAKGIPTEVIFFGAASARKLLAQGHAADLMAANNVLAHVPDINDFVSGFNILLKPQGVATFEFPSLHRQIEGSQFDTIYHEHFSYLSLLFVEKLMAKHGLRVFDVEELPTHGGSLRLFVCHDAAQHAEVAGLHQQRDREWRFGLGDLATYQDFARRIVDIKANVLGFFLEARRHGKSVAGYGAPAKGNTLLNYCGVGPEFLPFTVDRSPHKQGSLLPGSRIPVMAPEQIAVVKPDYVFILPWNLRGEIAEQMSAIRAWGGEFVVPIPAIEIF